MKVVLEWHRRILICKYFAFEKRIWLTLFEGFFYHDILSFKRSVCVLQQ